MTNYQFNALNDPQKADAVWDGTYLGDRQDDNHSILLYEVDSFYVEVYYHKEFNNITRFRSFITTDLLEPYLRQIDLLQLLNS